tara:strand:+ start:861 stop:1322 length:462 start_codon:yes stop_codon:yes gene_type:complete
MDYKKQNKDLSFGFKSENEIHEILEETFGKLFKSKLNPEMGEYYEFDKYNEKYFIEIKSRRIKHDQYNSLFFGKNKLIKGEQLLKKCSNLRIFYLWKCIDGIYGWEHKSSEYKICKRGRNDRGINEYDDCIDIKQKYIKPLKNLLDNINGGES